MRLFEDPSAALRSLLETRMLTQRRQTYQLPEECYHEAIRGSFSGTSLAIGNTHAHSETPDLSTSGRMLSSLLRSRACYHSTDVATR